MSQQQGFNSGAATAAGVQTINTIFPTILGNFTISSSDGSIGIAATTNGLSLTVANIANGYVQVNHAMSPYPVTASDYFISCDSTAGVITILLPNSPGPRREFIVKDRTGAAITNNITVTTVSGTDLIDDVTSYVFTDQFESLEVLFNGLSYETF